MEKENISIDFENSLGPSIGRTVKILEYHMQELFKRKGLDLTKEQMIVLKKLQDKNGMSQNELAVLTFRDKSSLARLLSKMEKKKYILRKPSKEDKRVNQVFITKNGNEIMEKVIPVIKTMIEAMEQNISFTEKQQVINTLKRIQHNLNLNIELL